MSQYVVDASVAAKWFLPEAYADDAQRLIDNNDDLFSPELMFHEMTSVMLKRVRRDGMPDERARGALAMLPFVVRPVSASHLAGMAMDIAIRYDRSAYDAAYVALAIDRGCRLVTADRRLYNALASSDLASTMLWIEDVPVPTN